MVRYSATRKAEKNPDYWDYATLMELAVLAKDPDDADEQLSEALGLGARGLGARVDGRNLSRMRRARSERGEDVALIERLEQELLRAAKEMARGKGAS